MVRAGRNERQGSGAGHAIGAQPRADSEQADVRGAPASQRDSAHQLATSKYTRTDDDESEIEQCASGEMDFHAQVMWAHCSAVVAIGSARVC